MVGRKRCLFRREDIATLLRARMMMICRWLVDLFSEVGDGEVFG